MSLSTREQLLALTDRRFADVTAPAPWGLSFRLRSLYEAEKSDYDAGNLNARGDVDVGKLKAAKARLIVACVVDEGGKPLFRAADLPSLMALDAGLVNWLYTQCRDHCGFGATDVDRAEKNSEPTPEDS